MHDCWCFFADIDPFMNGYTEENDMKKRCEGIISRIISPDKADNNILFNMDIWDWSQGVALYGMYKYYRLTGDHQVFSYLTDWFDAQMKREQIRNVNTMCPPLTLCCLYEETGRQAYLDFCLEWGEWVLSDMVRTDMGGIQHVTIDTMNEQQLWADTVFMTVLFLAKLSSLTGDARFAEEAKRQFLLHIHYLQDKRTGLWYHGWSFLRGDNFGNALWARGNCWFTIAASELEELMPLDGCVKDLILDAYRAQAEALCSMQDASGLWHTLIDDETSYLETSGSAGFAYGLLRGVRLGYLPERMREPACRAARAVIGQIGEDGMVQGVSYGTIVSCDLEDYRRVALRPTGYGQNLTLLMLTELMQWGFKGEDQTD